MHPYSPGSLLLLALCISCFLPASAQTGVPEAKPHIAYESTEWLDYRVFDSDRDDLPRVLLIGDSISNQYFEGVVAALKGKAYVGHLASSAAIELPTYLDEIKLAVCQHKYAVIHFNNGLHGWAYTEEEYRQGLEKLVAFLKVNAPAAKLIWATSTQQRAGPAPFDKFQPNNARILERNRIAAEIMARNHIPTDDLYTLMEPHHALLLDGTHYKPEGAALLVSQVSESILGALKK